MRVLQEKDREELLCYVRKEPEMNLFLIGDMENFGVESETVNFYLHEERGRWDFIILRFHQYFILYSQYEDYNAEEAVAFLRGQKPDCISGKTVLLERIAPAFPQWTLDSTYMSRCNPAEGGSAQADGQTDDSADVHANDRADGQANNQTDSQANDQTDGQVNEQTDSQANDQANDPMNGRAGGLVIRRLGREDVAEAIDLLSDIREFSKTYKKTEREEQIRRMADEMAQGSKMAVGGFLDGCMVSTASTSAENSESAMIVGVATVEGLRGRGYASAVVSALCRDCFGRGKKYLCLFYDNPVAGRIYNRIGFQELGEYGMLR